MSLFKTLLSHNPHSLLRPRNIAHKSFSLSSIFNATPPRTENRSKSKPKARNPLDIVFKEAVGIQPKPENSGKSDCEEEDNELKRKLRDLEREVRSLRENSSGESDGKGKVLESGSKEKGVYGLFTNRIRSGDKGFEKRRENSMVFKELSGDVKLFVSHLYKEGYMEDANFLTKNGNDLDFSCFDNSFGRGFIKFAAERFGKDNQEIANSIISRLADRADILHFNGGRWLSGSDLKNVAIFGCPSLERKSVFAAKRLRKFFQVQEDTVCSKCVLKQSCKFVNQNVWKTDTKKLILKDVLNVSTLYATEFVPPQLVVPDEMKASIGRLLNDVVKLSRTT
ncbi:hypothetical protein TIFTF001_034977 [Ficus carica]|uniref:Uncharacterized protein n=1 Tax=Ficus carica TaxID=3494 RepID=A0AA88E0S6_FICCA|nr:hypothetical protein TIFTF001_034977 [Ficus carica]